MAERTAPWLRGILLALVLLPGLCEVLATTPGLDGNRAPGWLAVPVSVIGFLSFLVLTGFTFLLGNLVVGIGLTAFLRHRWGWPLRLAALAATPYWIAFVRVLPIPW